MANKLEKLPIYQKADAFWSAVNAILQRPALGKDRKLHDQINAANDSILANMAEGFEQPTDKLLEKYLFVTKGSLAEVLVRLKEAHRKRYITSEELAARVRPGEELGRMLGGWIRYLARCGWQDRGRHTVLGPVRGEPPKRSTGS
jgi:four helix bundle protein